MSSCSEGRVRLVWHCTPRRGHGRCGEACHGRGWIAAVGGAGGKERRQCGRGGGEDGSHSGFHGTVVGQGRGGSGLGSFVY